MSSLIHHLSQYTFSSHTHCIHSISNFLDNNFSIYNCFGSIQLFCRVKDVKFGRINPTINIASAHYLLLEFLEALWIIGGQPIYIMIIWSTYGQCTINMQPKYNCWYQGLNLGFPRDHPKSLHSTTILHCNKICQR
jgi:hypothetical protein